MTSPSEKPGEACGETWTANRLARLEQLWKAGETAQAIAGQLGVSRSAVMGKLFRLGNAVGKRRARKKRGKQGGEEPGKKRGKKRGKSLLELENGDCRWPIGDPGSDKFHFCGEPGADFEQDVPYCAQHMQRAYVAPLPRKTGGPGAGGGWHAISSGITGERSDAVLRTAMAAVRRMFRDAIARKDSARKDMARKERT
jgi:GcrA cell cycle regulator